MKTFVKDLVVNAEVTSFFLIGDAPQVRKSKKDKDYWCLKLSDKTGEVEARCWEVDGLGDANQFKKCFVKIRGMVGEWSNSLQLSVSQLRKVVESDDVDPGDFFERSPFDKDVMWKELSDILLEHVSNGYLYSLVTNLLTANEIEFKVAPAAKSVHHNYVSGLLEHSLSLCKTAILLSDRYGLDKSLMLAGCVTHDIAKTRELTYEMGIGYSTEGTLLGHLAMGLMMISESINKIDGFPQELKIAILHLVAAHHGSLAWGSVKVPLMREAISFHICDLLDSRLAICDRAAKKGFDENGLTEWVKELEGPLWRGPWQSSADDSTVS